MLLGKFFLLISQKKLKNSNFGRIKIFDIKKKIRNESKLILGFKNLNKFNNKKIFALKSNFLIKN